MERMLPPRLLSITLRMLFEAVLSLSHVPALNHTLNREAMRFASFSGRSSVLAIAITINLPRFGLGCLFAKHRITAKNKSNEQQRTEGDHNMVFAINNA